MKALVVVESMFGNTRAVADAVAEGLRAEASVEVVTVTDAPASLPDDLDLLVLGGPTHAFSMSRPSTREDALRHAHQPAEGASASRGLREWIDAVVPAAGLRVVTFDTRVDKPFVPGSAAKSAARSLHTHGFDRAERGETFWVLDTPGPLKEGELDRARDWGRTLAG